MSSPKGDDIRDCEKHVQSALNNSTIVRILMTALKAKGCPLIPSRHISCEPCDGNLRGGFDDKVVQVVVCSNKCKTPDQVEEILAHELVHMYDFCTAKTDLDNNVNHLACTEVRAANLADCNFPSFSYGASHERCVKSKAADSVRVIKGVRQEEALRVVDKVYAKCSKDLEPFGRTKPKMAPSCLAFSEFSHFLSSNFARRTE